MYNDIMTACNMAAFSGFDGFGPAGCYPDFKGPVLEGRHSV